MKNQNSMKLPNLHDLNPNKLREATEYEPDQLNKKVQLIWNWIEWCCHQSPPI